MEETIFVNYPYLKDKKIFYFLFIFYEEKFGSFYFMNRLFEKLSESAEEKYRPEIYCVWINKCFKFRGVDDCRLIFNKALSSLKKDFVLEIGLKYAVLEYKLNHIENCRNVFKYLGKLFDPLIPEYKKQFWDTWKNFEEEVGDDESKKQMEIWMKNCELMHNV